MPKAKTGNFTLRKIVAACPAHLTAHRLAALQRSGQYSELRLIQRGKSAFDIVGYRWPDKGTRRKLNIGRARKNPETVFFTWESTAPIDRAWLVLMDSLYYPGTKLEISHKTATAHTLFKFGPDNVKRIAQLYKGQPDAKIVELFSQDFPTWYAGIKRYLVREENPNQKGATTPNQVKFGMRGRTVIGWINAETPTRYHITYKVGAQTREVWRRKDKVKFQATGKVGRVKNNCPKTANGPLGEAVAASEMFYGLKARHKKSQVYAWPKSLAKIGPCVRLEYLSDKFDGKKRQYFHDFGPGAEVFFDPRTQANGDALILIRGKFTIKPEGITG